jgi:hypothetical protein
MTDTMEKCILGAVYIVCLAMLAFVPKQRRRMAIAIYLFQETLAWIMGLLVVEYGLLAYPVRELTTMRTSFVFEFLALPTTSVYYNLYYPESRALYVRVVYTVACVAAVTALELWLEANTDLVEYIRWSGFWSFVTITLSLVLSRLYCKLFLRGLPSM